LIYSKILYQQPAHKVEQVISATGECKWEAEYWQKTPGAQGFFWRKLFSQSS